MKFALMKNVCPSCGSPLFTQKDNNLIATIQSRVASHRFSDSMNEEQIYDVSLFVFNEIKNGVGAIVLQDMISAQKKSSSASAGSESVDTEDIALEDIKKEIEEEYLSELMDENEYLPEDDEEDIRESAFGNSDYDIDNKADRLKRIHQSRKIKEGVNSKLKSPGHSFKGVSRLG